MKSSKFAGIFVFILILTSAALFLHAEGFKTKGSIEQKIGLDKMLYIEDVKFFESAPYELDILDEREYNSKFDEDGVRYVYTQVDVYNLLYGIHDDELDTVYSYDLIVKYYTSDWNFIAEVRKEFDMPTDVEHKIINAGFGWDQYGMWESDEYNVEVYIDGQKFAEGSFEVGIFGEEEEPEVENKTTVVKVHYPLNTPKWPHGKKQGVITKVNPKCAKPHQ